MAFLVSEERWWDETRWRSAAVRFTRITDVYETASWSKMTKKTQTYLIHEETGIKQEK